MAAAALFVAPFAVCTGLTVLCRAKQTAVHLVIWVFGIPVMYVVIPFAAMFVSFQVFGIDLLD